jgi:hypothetical protein
MRPSTVRTKPCEPAGRVRIAGGAAPEKTPLEVPPDEPEDEEEDEEDDDELPDELPDEPEELEELEAPEELEDPEDPEELDEVEEPEELLVELAAWPPEDPVDAEVPWLPELPQAANSKADAAPAAAKNAFNRITLPPMNESPRSLCGIVPCLDVPAVSR